MWISIWQQFASNHSANFTVAGTFEKREAATRAAEQLAELLPWIAARYRAVSARNTMIPWSDSEQESKLWPDWFDRYVEWLPGAKEDVERITTQLGRTVIVSTSGTVSDADPICTILAALGGGVLAGDGADSSGWTLPIDLSCRTPDTATALALVAEVRDLIAAWTKFVQGPWDLDEGSWEPLALPPYAPTAGQVQHRQDRLVFKNLAFQDLGHQLAAFMIHLERHGCTEIDYRITPSSYAHVMTKDIAQHDALREDMSNEVRRQLRRTHISEITVVGMFTSREAASIAAGQIRQTLETIRRWLDDQDSSALSGQVADLFGIRVEEAEQVRAMAPAWAHRWRWQPDADAAWRAVTQVERAVFVMGPWSDPVVALLRRIIRDGNGRLFLHGIVEPGAISETSYALTVDLSCSANGADASALEQEFQEYVRQIQQNPYLPIVAPWQGYGGQLEEEPADILAGVVRRDEHQLRFERMVLLELGYALPAFVAYLQAKGCANVQFVFDAYWPDQRREMPEADEEA